MCASAHKQTEPKFASLYIALDTTGLSLGMAKLYSIPSATELGTVILPK